MPNTATPADPFAYCEKKAASSGSSFYYAFRFLPDDQRRAIIALYAFCREVDDVVDECSDVGVARLKLHWWRDEVMRIYDGTPAHPVAVALHEQVQQRNLPKEYLLEIIDGMEMDLDQHRYETWSDLALYCHRVAGVVGLLSAEIFGYSNRQTLKFASELGTAFQLTNILRDLDEDAEIGRLYLPKEALDEAGITWSDPLTVLASSKLPQVCEAIVARAREHFRKADAIMARSPRRVVRAPRIMGQVYRVMLEGMAARGWAPPRKRVQVSGLRLSWIALQYAIV